MNTSPSQLSNRSSGLTEHLPSGSIFLKSSHIKLLQIIIKIYFLLKLIQYNISNSIKPPSKNQNYKRRFLYNNGKELSLKFKSPNLYKSSKSHPIIYIPLHIPFHCCIRAHFIQQRKSNET